jgi:ethylbenzene dioxygenase beta subunit
MSAHATPTTKAASLEEHREIEAFLHHEARLLDEGRYRDWLELLTDDVRYEMPTVENRYRRDGDPPAGRLGLFDDGMAELIRRIDRFECDAAWPEDPPTRHVHVVTNVEVFLADGGYDVCSTFVNHRSRGDHDDMVLYGRRRDRIARTADGLRLRHRIIHGSQSLLAARNLNTFL